MLLHTHQRHVTTPTPHISASLRPIALHSYHPNPTHTTAVRRGASWTAAYHLQLTVAAVARPIRSSVVPLGVLAAERSWVVARPDGLCPAEPPAGIQRSGAVAVSTLPGRRRGVSHRCPAGGVHPAGSSSGIRLSSRLVSARPVSSHPGSSSGVRLSNRLLSTRPVSSPLLSTRPASGRLVSAPPSVRSRPSPPTSGGGGGDQVEAAGQPSPPQRVKVPVGCRRPGAAQSTAEQP
jgi:hypothetical protein